jgi:hypothetical protein
MEPTLDRAAQWRVTTQPFRLTPQGRKLLEKAVPAWSEAQRQVKKVLGGRVRGAVEPGHEASQQRGRGKLTFFTQIFVYTNKVRP